MDSKGKTLAICEIGSKIFSRENCTVRGTDKLVRLFGVEFDSWHAEMRVLLVLLKNSYYQYLAKESGIVKITVIRITKSGKLARTSKPCQKCQRVIKIVKNKILSSVVFEILYHENEKWLKMRI